MRISFLVAFLLVLHTFVQAQKISGSVKGVIEDTLGKQDLEEATVSVSHINDSSDIQFLTTGRNGVFLVKNLKPDTYRLLISFEGYQTVKRIFTISPEHSQVDFNILYIQKAKDQLGVVIVQRPPMIIHQDTVEYNATLLATKLNAIAGDLLKKLPGVQVDKNGVITAQGETVRRVLVDGKWFFSDDTKLATRNLPPDIIDKIQVFDDLTYTYTNNQAAAYHASVPLLSPAIAKQLFKKKNGELRLSVFDLLNQNVSVSKTVTSNLVTYSRTNVITRYAMLTFTYNLNNFLDPKQKQMPGVFPQGVWKRNFSR